MTEAELEAVVSKTVRVADQSLLGQLHQVLEAVRKEQAESFRKQLVEELTEDAGRKIHAPEVVRRDVPEEPVIEHPAADGVDLLDVPVEGGFVWLRLNTPTVEIQGAEPTAAFLSMWQALRHLVCDEWNFCERRKDFADDVKLVTSLVAFLMPLVEWPVRATAIVVILAIHKGPAFMCDCNGDKS